MPTLTGPGITAYRAAALRAGLRLYDKTGIKPNTQWTPTAMLRAASAITGHPYKRGAYEAAIADLTAWLETRYE